MITKPKLKPDNPEQSKRFIEMARELGAADDAAELERIVKKAKRPKLHLSLPKDD